MWYDHRIHLLHDELSAGHIRERPCLIAHGWRILNILGKPHLCQEPVKMKLIPQLKINYMNGSCPISSTSKWSTLKCQQSHQLYHHRSFLSRPTTNQTTLDYRMHEWNKQVRFDVCQRTENGRRVIATAIKDTHSAISIVGKCPESVWFVW